MQLNYKKQGGFFWVEWEMKEFAKFGRPRAIGQRRMNKQELIEHLAFLKSKGIEVPEEAKVLAMERNDEEE
jgi:hypothetical protein